MIKPVVAVPKELWDKMNSTLLLVTTEFNAIHDYLDELDVPRVAVEGENLSASERVCYVVATYVDGVRATRKAAGHVH